MEGGMDERVVHGSGGMHGRGTCVLGGMPGRGCAWQGVCVAGGGGVADSLKSMKHELWPIKRSPLLPLAL